MSSSERKFFAVIDVSFTDEILPVLAANAANDYSSPCSIISVQSIFCETARNYISVNQLTGTSFPVPRGPWWVASRNLGAPFMQGFIAHGWVRYLSRYPLRSYAEFYIVVLWIAP